MIQNYLVFCIDGQAKYVQGSIPTGKLVANDINRNSIWVISPFYPTGIVRGSFQTKDRVIEQVSSTGLLRNDKISVDELVPTSASYYELVKDWNIWEIRVPQRILEFLSHHRTSEIGISFEFKDFIKPNIPSGITQKDNIIDEEYRPEENGAYVVKIPQYTYEVRENAFKQTSSLVSPFDIDVVDETIVSASTLLDYLNLNYDAKDYELNDKARGTNGVLPAVYYYAYVGYNVVDTKLFYYNDILVKNGETIYKLNRIVVGGNTPTVNYLIDPSIPADNYETVEPTLTDDILATLNEQGVSIYNLKLIVENDVIQSANDTDTIDATIIDDSPNGKILELELKVNSAKNDLIKNDNDGQGIYVSNSDVADTINDEIANVGPDTAIQTSIKAMMSAYVSLEDTTW